MLDVRHLQMSFGSRVALDDVSFRVQPGEIFGLLGPNGAGKTTLLSILAGLLIPTRGEVFLQGERFHPACDELKPLLGVVPQELAIYPELSPRENLRFFGSLYGVRDPQLADRVRAILDLIGLSGRADERCAAFSGGMKRRLNLGIALVHAPKILLLDEPTAGVDPQSRSHLFEGIRRLCNEGMTILYTSHYMEEVQALCPRLAILDHGKIVACDRLDALLALLPAESKPTLERVFLHLTGSGLRDD